MKPLVALNIRDVRHLCKLLGTSPEELKKISAEPKRYYRESQLVIKGKVRPIATPHGRLREILDRLQALLQRVSLPESIHGGRRGYSYITNALSHVCKPTVLCMDLKDFFPSVTNHRIYNVFRIRMGCTPDVARYLTRLTTLNGCLHQGSPTSTILAAIASEPLAMRLGKLAAQHRAAYTQYVDDVGISGPDHIGRLVPLVETAIRQEGFRVNNSKTRVASGNTEKTVTGLRVNQGPDVPRKKLREVRCLIDNLERNRNCMHGVPKRELDSIKGKIRFVEGLNHGAGSFLRRRLNRVLSQQKLIGNGQ